MKVTVIGCGRLGAPYAVALAEIGHDVLGVEVDPTALHKLQLGSAPFNEPGLDKAIATHHVTGRMQFTGSYSDAARFANIHFVCVPTPQQQGGLAADLTAVEAAITTLATHTDKPTLIVGKSSVPVGTTARLGKLAEQAAAPGVTVDVAWSPDFLRESTSLHDAAQPSRLIIGIPAGRSDVERTIRTVWASWLDTGVPLIVTDPATAELAKSAANAFLATKISFINAMTAICEAADADIRTLSRSLALDPRIGPAMLDAGLGFGGSCIPKDLRALAVRAHELYVPEAQFLRNIDAINIRRRRRVLALARDACGGDITGKRIAVWGAAFKPGTDDIRDSPALAVAADLIAAGADVAVHDPQALQAVRVEQPLIDCVEDLAEILDGAAVLLHLTHWDNYRDANPAVLAGRPKNAHVIDARGTLDANRWQAAGWTYTALGTGILNSPTACP